MLPEGILRIILLSYSWARIEIIPEVDNQVHLQGIHPRENDRAIPNGAPAPEKPKPGGEDMRGRGDTERTEQRQAGELVADFAVDITEWDIAQAGEYHSLGWPAYGAMLPIRRPEELLTDPIVDPGEIRNLPPKRGWAPGRNLGPLSRALSAAGATPLESHVFRILGSNFRVERPIVGGHLRSGPFRGLGPDSGPT